MLEIKILNVNCRLDREKNRGRKLVPQVLNQGNKPVPFEEYIPLPGGPLTAERVWKDVFLGLRATFTI